MVELEIGGEVIRCTDTHPFQVKGKGWVKAEKLQPGDLIYDKDWNTTPVERVDIIHLPEPVEVFNFEVEDCHTYYVGNGNLLVHNSCNHGKAWRQERQSHWKQQYQKYANSSAKTSDNGLYNLTDKNLDLMRRGKAPFGLDNRKVQLHHNQGITNNFYDYREISFTEHFSNFKALHPWLFGN